MLTLNDNPPSEASRMNKVGLGFAGWILFTGTALAGTNLETVIVEPVSEPHVANRSFATREDHITTLQRESRLSQESILTALASARQIEGSIVAQVDALWLVNRIVVTASSDVIAQLRTRSDIASVTPATEMTLIAPVEEDEESPDEKGFTYGLKKIRAGEAWNNLSVDGSGVVVGHLDTGVHGSHPDLKGKVILFKDFFYYDGEDPIDGQGHGTHTAGTIVGGNASGSHIGVAPSAKLIVGRIFNNQGSTTDAVILRAMNWIADPDGDPSTSDAPRLVSNSWGGPKTTDEPGGPLWDACQNWVDLGILPVFAAGNSGPAGKVGTPGAFPHVLSVGSTNWFNWLSYFSSRGPVVWEGTEMIKPEIVAPGSSIYSAKDGGGWVKMSGTSMACPHVAGVAALMVQAYPAITNEQIVEIMKSTAKDLGDDGPDNKYGWGLVDCVKVVERAQALAQFSANQD